MTKEQRANLYTARWAVRELLELDPKNAKLKLAEAELSEALGESAAGTPVKTPVHPNPAPIHSDNTAGRLVVIVGHEKKAPGATFALGGSEYQYNSKVAKEMVSYAKSKYSQLKVDVIFRDGIGISGAYAKARALKPTVCIELHFNAANKKAAGTETLTTTEASDKKFSGIVQSAVCRVFERPGNSRGVKTLKSGDRGAGNIYSLPGYANCLVEPFFGDNEAEAKLAQNKQIEYARALVDASMTYVKSLT